MDEESWPMHTVTREGLNQASWEDTGEPFCLSNRGARLEAGLLRASFPGASFLSWLSPQFFTLRAQRREREDTSLLKKYAVWEHLPSDPSDSVPWFPFGCPSLPHAAHVLEGKLTTHWFKGWTLTDLKQSVGSTPPPPPWLVQGWTSDLIRVNQNKDTFSEGFWGKRLHSSCETSRRSFFFFWIWTSP